MDIDKKFEELYEGWKKGKYTIKDKNGKILGTYSSGGKAQKAMDDLMQKGDYDKLEVSIVEEKEWHDGHEPQGGHDHHEEEEVEEKFEKEASSYFKKKKGKDEKAFGISKKKSNVRHGGSGYRDEEIDEAINLKQLKKQYDKNEDENKHTENYLLLAKAFGSKSEVKKVQDIMKRNEKQGHTSKSDMDWMYKNINPYYDKIRNEEYMKLEDTVKDVLVGKKEEPTVEEQKVTKEDSDKDEPGTQGDMAAYQKKRKAVAKKFGVSSCSQLDGAKKKACYSALDKAHVADHEEQVELEKMRKEETQKTFSKMFTHIKTLKQGK